MSKFLTIEIIFKELSMLKRLKRLVLSYILVTLSRTLHMLWWYDQVSFAKHKYMHTIMIEFFIALRFYYLNNKKGYLFAFYTFFQMSNKMIKQVIWEHLDLLI